jgi:hypothetical protein
MIKIDCSELTQDEQLALASTISEELQGRSLALVRGSDIVIDRLSGPDLDGPQLVQLVGRFIAKRTDPALYEIESEDDTIMVHGPDPIAAKRSRTVHKVPPGAFQCPACGLLLPDEGRYQTHVRTHDLIRGIR